MKAMPYFRVKHFFCVALLFFVCAKAAGAGVDLRLGIAGHAFDHLGNIGGQAELAAKTGATIIYATGLGDSGYNGLPPENEFEEHRKAVVAYNENARRKGIQTIIGYVCATSIVKLETFDKNWPKELSKLSTRPEQWRQIGRDGNPLPSWYGGDYQPACMNNPDWITYEKFIVRQQLQSGHDGIFFDNPTVHAQGCYCNFCMAKFSAYLLKRGVQVIDFSTGHLRKLADQHPEYFHDFRSGIARDFIMTMRNFAREIKSGAVVTCNNSLNSPDAFFSQCRTLGYNISELSKAEDWVTVEDMVSQPRILANGQTVEYGAVYKQLQAISHGKPIVAVTLADGDYHTPPDLMRVAMAEAFAHNASYLWWPTWEEAQQSSMLVGIRPAVIAWRRNEILLNSAPLRRDVLLFLPFRRWSETDRCRPCEISAMLTRSNVQYEILSEEKFTAEIENETVQARIVQKAVAAATPIKELKEQQSAPPRPKPQVGPLVVIESFAVMTPEERTALENFQSLGGRVITADEENWMSKLQSMLKASIILKAPETIRAVVHDQPRRTIVHLYNLNIEKTSSFTDMVHPATNVTIKVRLLRKDIRDVELFRTENRGESVPLKFTMPKGKEIFLETTIPKLETSAVVLIH